MPTDLAKVGIIYGYGAFIYLSIYSYAMTVDMLYFYSDNSLTVNSLVTTWYGPKQTNEMCFSLFHNIAKCNLLLDNDFFSLNRPLGWFSLWVTLSIYWLVCLSFYNKQKSAQTWSVCPALPDCMQTSAKTVLWWRVTSSASKSAAKFSAIGFGYRNRSLLSLLYFFYITKTVPWNPIELFMQFFRK